MKNNKEELPPSFWRKVRSKTYKIFTFFIIIVLLISSVGLYTCRNLGMGYKYYEMIDNQASLVGITQEENIISSTIEDYLLELAEKGYYVVTSELDTILFCKQTVINKTQINDDVIKKAIINSLNISVLSSKLIIENDETAYYFKSETECENFVKQLNKYIEQKYTIEDGVEDYKVITSQEVLDQKLKDVQEERAAIDKKAKEESSRRNVQVTSRGSSGSRTSNYKGGAPMASYVYISSYYGMRNGSMHTGVDFAAAAGTSIYAWKDGKVKSAGWSGGYGNFIIVEHSDGTVSRYAHCSGFAVSAGQSVVKGQTIGYVGSTGNSTGPHLHFEIKVNGNFVNPLNYL